MGYHTRKIKRGEFGKYSKIIEEFEEFQDAHEQKNKIMELIELSDLLGAIEAYTKDYYDISLDDLIIMKNATKSAFQKGKRQPL